MSIDTLLTTIQQALISYDLVKKQAVFVHAGKFTWAELKRRSFAAPALFVSALGFREATGEDDAALMSYEYPVTVSLVIGVVTKHVKDSESRNAHARTIAEQICIRLKNQNWGLQNALAVKNVKADGVFSAPAEAENCSMWLVTFNQSLGLDSETWQSDLDDFLRAFGTAENESGDTLIETTINLEDV